MDTKKQDTASEPVQPQGDDEFMDTGILHEPKKKKATESRAEDE